MNKFLKQYQDFVDEVTSDSSKSLDHMIDSIDLMHEQKLTPSRLLTAGIGLSGEVGEFNEIIKKILFQGKEIDENTEHEDPEQIPYPVENYYMWECDDIEHLNGPYADGGFTVYEVPADGNDDYDYDNSRTITRIKTMMLTMTTMMVT